MNRAMTDIIRNQKPVTLPPTASVQDACRAMHVNKVGAVLVTHPADTLAGIFTGRDVVRVMAEGANPAATPLQDVMTRTLETLPPGSTAIEALRLMRDGGFRHLPVVHEGRLVGVVSRGDFRGLEQDRLEEEVGVWECIR